MNRFLVGLLLVWLGLFLPGVNAAPPLLDQQGDPLPPGAVARLGSSRLTHADTVEALAFTADGKGLLAGARDGSLILWDVPSGKERLCLVRQGPAISAVAVSPDGKLLVACQVDGDLAVWDSGSGQRIDTWPIFSGRRASIRRMLFLPDGQSLLLLGERGTRRDVRTARPRPLPLEPLDGILCAAVAPSGRTLAVYGSAGFVLHELPSEKVLVQVKVPSEQTPLQLAFSSDGGELFSLDRDQTIRVRDSRTAEVLRTMSTRDVCPLLVTRSGQPLRTTLTSDGCSLLISRPEASRLVFNPSWQPGKLDGRPLPPLLDLPASVALSPDLLTLAVADNDNQVRLWDLRTGKQLAGPRTQPVLFYPGGPRVSLSPDGRLLALLDRGILTVGETVTGRTLWQTPDSANSEAAAPDGVRSCIFSADSKQLLVLEECRGRVSSLTFCKADSGKVLRSLPSLPKWVSSLAVSPDGRWLAGVRGRRQPYRRGQGNSGPVPERGRALGRAGHTVAPRDREGSR